MKVAVLGASPNKHRFSYQAVQLLRQYGHEVFPINPAHSTIEGIPTFARVDEVNAPLDTVTVYVSPKHIEALIPQIIAAAPKRVIANPGAESDDLENAVTGSGIEYIEDCTLVMLRGGYF